MTTDTREPERLALWILFVPTFLFLLLVVSIRCGYGIEGFGRESSPTERALALGCVLHALGVCPIFLYFFSRRSCWLIAAIIISLFGGVMSIWGVYLARLRLSQDLLAAAFPTLLTLVAAGILLLLRRLRPPA